MNIRSIKSKVLPVLRSQGVEKAAVFGSFATGKFGKNSDIDLLVKLRRNKTLFDLVDLKLNLERVLGKKVDVITYNSLSPYLRKKIIEEQKIIYERS